MSRPKLDHIGIAVADLEESVGIYRLLGFDVKPVEEIPPFGVKVAFLDMESGAVELVQPVDDQSPVARFLAKRGQGVHHISFLVQDIRSEMARLQAGGILAADPEPREGAHGSLVAFLHPKSTGGVLIELVERKKE